MIYFYLMWILFQFLNKIHARRPYAEFIKALKRNDNPTTGSIAEEAYRRITEITQIDNTFDDLSISERKKQRQLQLVEKVDAYFAWAKMKYEEVPKQSQLEKALAYSINQEPFLRVFLSDSRVPMDNNYALYSGYFYPHLLSKSA